MMLNTLKYYFKNTIGYLFKICGGIYLIKYILKKKPYYMVFNYHNFSKYNNYKIKRGPILETGYSDNFEKQILFLKKHFTFLYPAEFFEGHAENGLNILITFDDGYKDNYDLAFPVLKMYQAKSIFFVVSSIIGTSDFLLHDKIRYLIQNGYIAEKYNEIPTDLYRGKQNYDENVIDFINDKFEKNTPSKRIMMNSDEILSISNANFYIGNHTDTHRGLSFLKLEEQCDEIYKCESFLNSKIERHSLKTIAYPNGLFNEDTVAILKKSNIDYGFTISPGFNNMETDSYKLKRIGLNASDSRSTICLKIGIELMKMLLK
ncbi:MAG: peptidoglycan/xylan/chitin deacetylase (PgdA/CDA1 family) [Flavobacteriaceae bacterium]|jgi:peptidoglycan/xylan/chitin deacetylase (PgdA/CDA1 family)